MHIDTTLQFAAMPGALMGGSGDYVIIFEPTASTMEQEGKGYIVASLGKESGEVPYTAYFAKKSTIENNPELIEKFTRAIYKGQQWVDSHTPEEIAQAIRPHFPDEPEDILVKAVANYKEQNSWKKDPLMLEKISISSRKLSEMQGIGSNTPYERLSQQSLYLNRVACHTKPLP